MIQVRHDDDRLAERVDLKGMLIALTSAEGCWRSVALKHFTVVKNDCSHVLDVAEDDGIVLLVIIQAHVEVRAHDERVRHKTGVSEYRSSSLPRGSSALPTQSRIVANLASFGVRHD